jgi:hypothetical protein
MALHKPKQLYVLGKLHFCSIKPMKMIEIWLKITFIFIKVGIWRVKKCFPQNGVPIWSFWRNIRFLPSIFAEKNVTKNEHICSMCIKINSRQTGSRNLTGPKTLPTIWHTYMRLGLRKDVYHLIEVISNEPNK